MSKIVILMGSPRKGGNTDLLAHAFAEGASAKHEVELIPVADYKIDPCIGCNSCFSREDHSCFQKDDMAKIYEKMKQADTLVIASPVYFYGISAQLKALVDRFHNPIRNDFPLKRLGLILVGADKLPTLFDSMLLQYKMTLEYFHLESIGTVLVRGAQDKGDVHKTDGLKQARELGEKLE
ncbi:MAG: flavodoxin family protein [Schwartzia sp.]|nr:flavodoxin family protein [Schwartzia sp. (in: firmicutes)]